MMQYGIRLNLVLRISFTLYVLRYRLMTYRSNALAFYFMDSYFKVSEFVIRTVFIVCKVDPISTAPYFCLK